MSLLKQPCNSLQGNSEKFCNTHHVRTQGVNIGYTLVHRFLKVPVDSQIVREGCCYEWPLYVRGYHVYQSVWTPPVWKTPRLTVEPTNMHDAYTVAVEQDKRVETVVGHVPRNVSQVISFFLKKDRNVGYCKVTGERINCGAGHLLEIPCVYKFYRSQHYVEQLVIAL